VWKKFKIRKRQGGDQEYKSLRVALTNALSAPRRLWKKDIYAQKCDFWALKDISFNIHQGEVVGIIGRNGAGKSTLLKVLSQITEPTQGVIRIRGRVASLLEVGTGFHPELTGRENVFLNGAILGMKRAEIRRKFDEIVSFAEVETFIDTPVKRYSSGMYLRLAFAVAAHLEPEILLVDEVLAVGDAQFQKKCLEKMDGVAKENRTVLFVSHNMQAVQSLCKHAIQIDGGRIVNRGDPSSVVAHYLSSLNTLMSGATWDEQNAPGSDEARLLAVRVHSDDGLSKGVYSSKENLYVAFEIMVKTKNSGLCVGFDLISSDGIIILRSYQTDVPEEDWGGIKVGRNYFICTIPHGFLNGGVYYVSPKIKIHATSVWIVNLDGVVQFEVVLDHGVSPLWNSLDGSSRPGKLAPILKWKAL
jgi:lipopolysaccharide transport system ATP-binding protein